MGYSYEFSGRFRVRPPLSGAQRRYLLAFGSTRRVTRKTQLLKDIADPIREAVSLPIGLEGCYFIGTADDLAPEPHPESIIDGNRPPGGQPGLWCQWVPDENGCALHWDGGEKFHNFEDWLVYLVDHFLKPWGCVLEGQVEWQGNDEGDRVFSLHTTTPSMF